MKDPMPSKVNEKLQLKYSEKEISLPKKNPFPISKMTWQRARYSPKKTITSA